jgi:hypothetical protein
LKTKISSLRLLTVASLLLSEVSTAGPEKFLQEGFILNDVGGKCWYQQTVISDALHFHGDAISTTVGELVFADPQCMRDSGEGLAGNKTLINEVLATWYSHPDANFDTQNLHKSSLYQEVGECMQSRSYAAIAVAVDYVVADQSIVKVIHGPTLEGCLI